MKRILSICLLLVLATTALFAQADLQPLATVKIASKAESITLKNLKARCESYKKQTGLTTFTIQQKQEILDSLINEKLFVQAGNKMGIVLTDKQVDELFLSSISNIVGTTVTLSQFAQLVQQQAGMTLEEFFQNQMAMSVDEYKQYMKNNYIAQQYVLAKRSDEISQLSATDSEIRSYYEMNKASFVQSDILQLTLVVVPKNNNASDALAKIQSLYNNFTSGKKTFSQMKIEMQQPNAGFQVGDMYISKNQDAAAELGLDYASLLQLFQNNIGFVSEIINEDTNYQFYQITDKTSAKILGLSDLVQPGTTTTLYEYIRASLTAQKQSAYLTTAIEEISAELRTPENYQMLKTGSALEKLLEGW